MLKFYSLIIGENPNYTASFQPASKRKIALYANCLMVPVILWFINGYLLVSHVLEGGIYASILTAFIAAFIIFLIERAIIMSNGSKPIFWFRIFLGFIIASLGSISLDEVIFKQDIDNQVALYKQLEVDDSMQKFENNSDKQIETQETKVKQKYNKWQSELKDAKGEADGTSGSRQKLVGPITIVKLKIAEQALEVYKAENAKLDLLKSNLEEEKKTAKIKAETDFQSNALLLRIQAMFDLIAKNKFMLLVYILFTLFIFCLEFLVVLIKIGSKNSFDEDLELVREKLLRSKTKKRIDRSEALYQPEHFFPLVKKSNQLVSQTATSAFS